MDLTATFCVAGDTGDRTQTTSLGLIGDILQRMGHILTGKVVIVSLRGVGSQVLFLVVFFFFLFLIVVLSRKLPGDFSAVVICLELFLG
jgi:hypothetical protein